MDFSKIFTPQAIAANFTETYSNTIPFLGAAYFPVRKQAGLDLKWIKGKNGLPVSLAPSTFDAKARFIDRIPVQAVQTEMPFFREGYLMREQDRQDMLRAQSSGDPYAQAAIEQVYNDTNNLIMSAMVVSERMIWQLLAPANGKPGIAIVEDGVDYTYDYDPDSSFKTNNYMEVSTNKWNDAAQCDPLEDLRTAMDKAQDNGSMVTTAIMSRKTFNYILKSEKVKAAVLATQPTGTPFMTDRLIKALIMENLGLDIIIYNKKYKGSDGTAKQFYPDDMITLLPDGAVGRTCYGTTPEEADLMMANSNADVSLVNEGIAITRIVNSHPVTTEFIASEIVLPSFERMDEVFVMKVV